MRALIWLAILAAVLVGATALAERTAWQLPWVTLRVENATQGAVTALRLTRGGKTRDYGPLAPGAARTIRYLATGPTAFRLEVRTAGGQVHRAGAGGVHPGWTIAQRVTVRGIESSFRARAVRRPWQRAQAPAGSGAP